MEIVDIAPKENSKVCVDDSVILKPNALFAN